MNQSSIDSPPLGYATNDAHGTQVFSRLALFVVLWSAMIALGMGMTAWDLGWPTGPGQEWGKFLRLWECLMAVVACGTAIMFLLPARRAHFLKAWHLTAFPIAWVMLLLAKVVGDGVFLWLYNNQQFGLMNAPSLFPSGGLGVSVWIASALGQAAVPVVAIWLVYQRRHAPARALRVARALMLFIACIGAWAVIALLTEPSWRRWLFEFQPTFQTNGAAILSSTRFSIERVRHVACIVVLIGVLWRCVLPRRLPLTRSLPLLVPLGTLLLLAISNLVLQVGTNVAEFWHRSDFDQSQSVPSPTELALVIGYALGDFSRQTGWFIPLLLIPILRHSKA